MEKITRINCKQCEQHCTRNVVKVNFHLQMEHYPTMSYMYRAVVLCGRSAVAGGHILRCLRQSCDGFFDFLCFLFFLVFIETCKVCVDLQ